VSGYLAGPGYIAYVFGALGLDHEYVNARTVQSESDRYRKKIVDSINKGVPVLIVSNLNDMPVLHSDVGTHCLVAGYNNNGNVLQLLFGGTEPVDCPLSSLAKADFVFIGEKERDVTLEELYIGAVKKMPYWLTLPARNGMYFGAAAFRAWADDIEAGRFEDDKLAMWENYGVYVCNLATSPAIPTFILKKLARMNPAYSSLMATHDEIVKLFPSFKPDDITPDESRDGLWSELEFIGGGMNLDAVKLTMRDKGKRAKVAAVLRNYANRLDKALDIISEVAAKI